MRSLGLILLLFGLHAVMQTAAAPIQGATDIPLFGTVGAKGPTAVPNLSLPIPPPPAPRGLPAKRATHRGDTRLQPRNIHSADYGAAPNTTIPAGPSTSTGQAMNMERRGTKKAQAHREKAKTKSAPHRGSTPAEGIPSPGAELPSTNDAASSGATGAEDGVKAAGALPKEISPAVDALPLSELSDTPITKPDAPPAPDPPPPPPPVPAAKVESTGTAKEGVYPTYQPPGSAGSSDFVGTNTAAHASKRHDLIFDTDPLLPPSGGPDDPRMGVVNLDSNHPAQPAPEEEAPEPQEAKAPEPDRFSKNFRDPDGGDSEEPQ